MKTKITKIEHIDYAGDVYNMEVTPSHKTHDDQYYVCADTGIVVHNCHPRDNIALRHMAEKYNLGYDLFETIMGSREVQAQNIAKFCAKYGTHVCIVGKAYKPSVPYTNGSYSILIGHYLTEMGVRVDYTDPNTNDPWVDAPVYLIGYWEEWVENIDFPSDSTIIDPWRRPHTGFVQYGNSRRPDYLA